MKLSNVYSELFQPLKREPLKHPNFQQREPHFLLWQLCILSLLEESRARDRKVPSSSSGWNGGRIFAPELTFCADSYSVSVPPRVTAVAHKRHQKYKWLVAPKYAYTFDPMKSEWADYAFCTQCGNLLLRKTSSHGTYQGILGHSRLRFWATVDWSWPKK